MFCFHECESLACENINYKRMFCFFSPTHCSQTCPNGHVVWRWSSQPTVKCGIQAGDFMLATNILLSGSNYSSMGMTSDARLACLLLDRCVPVVCWSINFSITTNLVHTVYLHSKSCYQPMQWQDIRLIYFVRGRRRALNDFTNINWKTFGCHRFLKFKMQLYIFNDEAHFTRGIKHLQCKCVKYY